ncbi:unnamed protein product [Euphydryas editha]|uniref:C2HC/C3H-type domain-containing protein n=1 Tax=Euphydryas editha TaxID=104508 RepID=A0AAU9U188_EUPED|nr:unnamed protein product [Euphydryas editha]
MKKRTISKLKSIFGSKKGKRQQEQQSAKSSRSPSPELPSPASSGESFRPIQRTPPPSRIGPPPSPPVPTNPVAPVAPEPSGPLPLSPCPVCGRTFVPQSLAKHVKICEKMTVKKRKTFDSSRQRREGTDLEQYLPKNFGLPENSPFLEKSPPNTAKAAPKPKVHSVRSAIMKPAADLQKCPHCNRAFGMRAFERHVEWCADKAKILPAAPAQPPPHIADAKQRLNARTQYKAPPVRGRRSSQTREKSSNSRSASVESTRGISPPREFGDYRHTRTRASESASSNDHEDNSPHVPVIRNSRNAQNNSSGDANVKARQARLARDLSSSRPTQESDSINIQQTNTDPNITKKNTHCKPKCRYNVKKREQLKKLEEIANKYNERNQNTQKDTSKNCTKNLVTKEFTAKSQIPVPRKIKVKSKNTIEDNILEKIDDVNLTETIEQPVSSSLSTKNQKSKIVINERNIKNKIKGKQNKVIKDNIRKTQESTLSLDSLENSSLTKNQEKNNQSIGINTELLCPCIPCVIYANSEQKPLNKTLNKTKQNNKLKAIKINSCDSTVELLYKNPNITNLCEVDSAKTLMENNSQSNENISLINCEKSNITESKSFTDDSLIETNMDNDNACEKSDRLVFNVEYNNYVDPNNKQSDETMIENITNLSAENIEENYEHDLSNESFDDSFDTKKYIGKEEDNIDLVCRHSSGDTYTKFTENPADLEEFLNLTDKMINDDKTKLELITIEKSVQDIHTPRTDSIESINKEILNNSNSESIKPKPIFSDTLEELKSNLKDLLEEVDQDANELKICKQINESEIKKNVCDMEHITVYELQFSKQQLTIENSSLKEEQSVLKLPSIKVSNKCMDNGNEKQTLYNVCNTKKNYKLLNNKKRSNKEYRTFIIKENQNDNTDETPPLKLPCIENKRLDDNYDPFVSAARQMKELMSSDTNIPKKLNTSKDSNRTLPSLRPKEKLSTSYRSDNTKMIKDTINKTYQKTPTLQRMKSFGSSTNDNNSNSFGGRCSSFRINRNDRKPSQKLNTTFTKSSKENISSTEKSYLNRSSNLNRSFSSYSNSSYSTPKLKDKIPKISQSMHHGFQRNTSKQPLKLDKITNNKTEERKDFVNLDAILSFDSTSMTDSNYIDPRLINENDNLPINVNTILSNPDMISSMESLLTTENLPAKFESFSAVKNNEKNIIKDATDKIDISNHRGNKVDPPLSSEFSSQYNKMMSSLEQSIASKTSIRDDDSLCEDFDLEEFMISFDDEVHKQKIENKRTCSSTTRVVAKSDLSNNAGSETKVVNSPKVVTNGSNGLIPVNKSNSLVFSSNNIVSDKIFPSSIKRSTSLLDSIQKKTGTKIDNNKGRHKTDQLEEDLMQSLKDFDKLYESETNENQSIKATINNNKVIYNDKSKKEFRRKVEHKSTKNETTYNGNYTPNGKSTNDSAYSSLNRISPSKLSLCNAKESNGINSLEPVGSDTNSSHKDDIRSISSEEFLAMERSAELDEPLMRSQVHKDMAASTMKDKIVSSRASSRHSPNWRPPHETLSSSGSETSLHQHRRDSNPVPRLSRFCHECGSKFPVETAKFCIECGVKRLVV